MKDWLTKIKIGIAVARAVTGGKHGKIFDRIEQGSEIATKADEIAEMIKAITKKKKKT